MKSANNVSLKDLPRSRRLKKPEKMLLRKQGRKRRLESRPPKKLPRKDKESSRSSSCEPSELKPSLELNKISKRPKNWPTNWLSKWKNPERKDRDSSTKRET